MIIQLIPTLKQILPMGYIPHDYCDSWGSGWGGGRGPLEAAFHTWGYSLGSGDYAYHYSYTPMLLEVEA